MKTGKAAAMEVADQITFQSGVPPTSVHGGNAPMP
jgi:hypothetical protein